MSRYDELIAARREKQAHLTALGISTYPIGPSRERSLIGHVLRQIASGATQNDENTVMGRVLGMRGHGKVLFVDVHDISGKIQGIIKSDITERAEDFQKSIDIGDIIALSGIPMKSQRGEPSIEVHAWEMLAKALEPLPDTWSGLEDQERRYRERELDLLMDAEQRHVFEQRATVLSTIRSFLNNDGFMEVQTPMLQLMAGGTLAEPFKTHHHALDIPLYLRIAPEIYLKRCIVGGWEKVFELGQNFRNEGMSTQHLQEFTMVEAYQAYTTAMTWKERTERLLREIATQLFGGTKIVYAESHIDLGESFPVFSYDELFVTAFGRHISDIPKDAAEAMSWFAAAGFPVEVSKNASWGKVIDEGFKTYIRPSLRRPTWVRTYPKALSPLAKEDPLNPGFVDQWQLLMQGHEIVKMYSELNDPDEQERRFEEQHMAAARGDTEAHPNDQLFIKALRRGLPPTAGWGLGVDRLLTILLQKDSIRDVVLFPLMRPE